MTCGGSAPRDYEAKVAGSRALGDGSGLLAVECEAIASAAEPGQFVMVRAGSCGDPFLGRPLAVAAASGGIFKMLYRVVGRGTELLASKRQGDSLVVRGPIGRGFFSSRGDIPLPKKVFLAGGSVGAGSTALRGAPSRDVQDCGRFDGRRGKRVGGVRRMAEGILPRSLSFLRRRKRRERRERRSTASLPNCRPIRKSGPAARRGCSGRLRRNIPRTARGSGWRWSPGWRAAWADVSGASSRPRAATGGSAWMARSSLRRRCCGMSSRTEMYVSLGGLHLESPVIIASGVWPYEAELWSPERLEGVGALCTKAVSLNRRAGNKGVRVWETPCGMLNSIGLQNSGVAFLPRRLSAACPGGESPLPGEPRHGVRARSAGEHRRACGNPRHPRHRTEHLLPQRGPATAWRGVSRPKARRRRCASRGASGKARCG